MAITLTTGSTLSVAKSYAANLATSLQPPTPTLASWPVSGSTVAVGDYVEVNSGWGLLDKRIDPRRCWHYRHQDRSGGH
jgi:hypothetical protein